MLLRILPPILERIYYTLLCMPCPTGCFSGIFLVCDLSVISSVSKCCTNLEKDRKKH